MPVLLPSVEFAAVERQPVPVEIGAFMMSNTVAFMNVAPAALSVCLLADRLDGKWNVA